MATLSWIGSAGGSWTTAADWSSGRVPTRADDVVISQAGTYTISDAAAAWVKSLLLDAAGAVLALDAPIMVSGPAVFAAGTVEFNGGTLFANTVSLANGMLTGATIAIVTPTGEIGPSGTTIVWGGPTDIASAPVDWAQSVTVPQLSPYLGTLQSVGAFLSADMAGTLSVIGLEGIGIADQRFYPGTVTLFSPNGTVIASATAVADTGLQIIGAGTADGGTPLLLSPEAMATAGGSIVSPGSLDVSALSGTGTVALPITASASLHLIGPANMQLQSQASLAADASLYYTAIPSGPSVGPITGVVIESGYSGSTLLTSYLDYESGPLSTTQLFTFADRTTGWADSVAIRQFDTTLGALLGVQITLTSDVVGSVAAEDIGTTGGTLTALQSAALTVTLPGTGTMTATVSISANMTLGGYDGTTDWSGASGSATGPMTNSVTQDVTLTGADLDAFIGQGTVSASLSDIGTGTVDGPANLAAWLQAEGGGTLQVNYLYTPDALSCFAEGTRIETPAGPVAVEALRDGDLVVCRDGSTQRVIWLGHRHIDCRRHKRPEQVWPASVRAGTFGPAQPVRDLFLSPDHAVFVNHVLVPVKCLIDGEWIAQLPVDAITYYHVELPQHDLLLAEGLAVESYLDVGDRANFANGGGSVTLFPNFAAIAWEAVGCAPLVVSGPELAAARALVAGRTGAGRAAA